MSDNITIDPANIPRHVAIIMDGNGRWAEKRGLLRIMGHKTGVDSVKDIVKASRELGVKVLTIYAFSTENWKRPLPEIKGLMSLLKHYLESELAELVQNQVCLRSIGHQERLPEDVREVLDQAILRTADNQGLILNLALSYGARDEIVMAARSLAGRCLAGEITPAEISEELFDAQLFTAGLPDPDLLIRTGGEYRLSNFLLWQMSYTELYITETHWPDFRKKDLIKAIADYQQRQRRFGKTGQQLRES